MFFLLARKSLQFEIFAHTHKALKIRVNTDTKAYRQKIGRLWSSFEVIFKGFRDNTESATATGIERIASWYQNSQIHVFP